MSELITAEIFTDGQQNINAANMNGIIGNATVQPDVILNKPVSAAMNIADQFLVLKTDNTLAKSRFDTITNSVSSQLPLADTTKNGSLRQVSGKTTDFVDGTNNCRPISTFLPPGVVVDYAAAVSPAGWLLCNGQAVSRTTYAALYAIIGAGYGAGDGSTTFNVPNYTGKVLAMAGGSYGGFGGSAGAATVALATGNLPSHTHTLGNHTHLGANHTHSMQNHTHGMDHAHGMDHNHNIGSGQFSHVHGYTNPLHSSPGTGGQTQAGGTYAYAQENTTASTLPAGNTLYASQTNSAWSLTLYASQTNGAWGSTGGTSIASTSLSEQGLTTGGPSTNTSDATGSGTAFSILPPFQTTYKIIKT